MTQRDEGHNYRDSKNKAQAYERKQKYEAIIDMVIRWLDSNIDEWHNAYDTAYLKHNLLNNLDVKIKNAIADDSRDLNAYDYKSNDWSNSAGDFTIEDIEEIA